MSYAKTRRKLTRIQEHRAHERRRWPLRAVSINHPDLTEVQKLIGSMAATIFELPPGVAVTYHAPKLERMTRRQRKLYRHAQMLISRTITGIP